MKIEDDSVDNIGLTAAMANEAQAGAHVRDAKAALWRSAGHALVGAVVPVGLGAGAWLALAGWSLVPATKTITEQVVIHDPPAAPPSAAQAPHDAAPPPKDQTDTPRPSRRQLQPDVGPASKAKVVTGYTIFKSVPFGRTRVETGWDFTDSNEARPSRQFCHYYLEPASSGLNTFVTIGINGTMEEVNTQQRQLRGVSLEAAFRSCVWFPDLKI
jgi:hypothetical protein